MVKKKRKVFQVSFIAGKGKNKRFIRRQELSVSKLGAKQKIGRVFNVSEFRRVKVIKDKNALKRQLRRIKKI